MKTLDDIHEDRQARKEQRLRELGTRKPRCTTPGCDETDPLALTGVHPQIVCYECQASRSGKKRTEDHHLAGSANDAQTAATPANDHRVLSEMQTQEWPIRTIRNPDGSPLLRAAAFIRSWLDHLRLVVERAIGWIPPFLEWLDERLGTTLGPRWWIDLGWQGQS